MPLADFFCSTAWKNAGSIVANRPGEVDRFWSPRMTRKRLFSRLLLAFLLAGGHAVAVSGAPLYRQDFPNDKGESLSEIGWDDSHNGGNGNTSGVSKNEAGVNYLWWYSNMGLAAASTNTGACITTKLDPIPLAGNPLNVRWEQRLENLKDDNDTDTSGTPAAVRLAVQVDGRWFASQDEFKTTPAGVGNGGKWDANEITFDPAAKNWREMNLAGEEAKLGSAPTGALAGSVTGLGFVTTFAQHQTVNFHFIEIDRSADPASSEQKMK
jgi:hypothetical protein